MTDAVQIIFPSRPLGTQNAVTTVAQLRALSSSDVNANTEVLVAAQGFYRFDPSSLAADDGATVIKPTDLTTLQAGRWLVVLLQSASLTAFIAAGTGAVTRNAQDKMRERPSIEDFGAVPDAVTNTPAITLALANAGRSLTINDGNYAAGGLAATGVGRTWIGLGETNIVRESNGVLLSTSSTADDLQITNVSFYGNGFTGNLLEMDGDRGRFLFCAPRAALAGSYVLRVRGSRWTFLGDRDSYDGSVKIISPGAGPASLYHNFVAVQVTGILDLEDTGFVVTTGCLLGGLLVAPGAGTAGTHGSKHLATRIVGTGAITQSSTVLGSGCAMSGNLTLGSVAATITNITIDPSFLMDASVAHTLTINDNVQESQLWVDQMLRNQAAGGNLTVVMSDTVRANNRVYHGTIAYTPTLSGGAGGSNFVAGTAGSKIAHFSQTGNEVAFDVTAVVGSSGTTIPTGAGVVICTLPVAIANRPARGIWELNIAGTLSFGFWNTNAGKAVLYHPDATILTWTQVNTAGAVLTIVGNYGL